MSVTRAWKVYGVDGHRQRESFFPSALYDWSDGSKTRILEVINSDKTGTNEFTILRITRNTAKECENEFSGQLSDGVFENSRYGRLEEVDPYTYRPIEFLSACASTYAELGYNVNFYYEFVGYKKEEAFRILDEYAELWGKLPEHDENFNMFTAPIGPRDKYGCILAFRKDVCARLENTWFDSLSAEEANALLYVLESTPGIKQQIEIEGDLIINLNQLRAMIKAKTS